MAILDALKKKDEEKKDSASSSVKEEKKTASKTSDKKETDVPKEAKSTGNSEAQVAGGHINVNTVLKHPHITEKAAIEAEKGVYTFLIHPDANKIEVARAVQEIYNVEPERVRIVHLPAKKLMSRGRRGMRSAKKKALVYLKKGDKIEFV